MTNYSGSTSQPGSHDARDFRESDSMTTRPAILRALTDLFTLRPSHTDEDIARFEELALRILGDAGPTTLAYVAAKLARHPSAPPNVLSRIAEADRASAAIIIEHAVNLPLEDQISVAVGRDGEFAMALARRRNLSGVVTEGLISRNDPAVTQTLAENPTAQFNRSGVEQAARGQRLAPGVVEQFRERSMEPIADAAGFMRADPQDRAKLITAAARKQIGRKSTPAMVDKDLLQQVIESAQDQRWDVVAHLLGSAIGWSAETAAPLVNDRSGEPLALLLAAAGCDSEEAVRVFLCCPESISHSYARVRTLSLIVRDTPPATACDMLSDFIGIDAQPSRAPKLSGAPAERMRPSESPRLSGVDRLASVQADQRRAPQRERTGKTTLLMRRGG